MVNTAWRVRLLALSAAGGFLVMGLGIRMLAGRAGVLDGSSALTQHAGTALYAAMIYAGVFLVAPAAEPWVAGIAAIAFCWSVEGLQLTGLPAELSDRSVLARLVLGVQFDASDLAWYAIGVLPLVAVQAAARRRAASRRGCTSRATG